MQNNLTEITLSDSNINCDFAIELSPNNRHNLDSLDREIRLYSNNATRFDYSIAVASGMLCGLIDSLFVGPFSFEEGMQWTNEKMSERIIELAKKKGWNGITKGENKGTYPLNAAISYLEERYKMPSDSLKDVFGGSRQHHLRDFAHHHSIIGLFFSILTQFTGMSYGTDTNGNFIKRPVPEEMIGKDLKRKYAIVVTDWSLHLASDMHGSNATAGLGCGIPGPIVSLIKALSALPIFKGEKPGDNKLSLFAAKLYNGTLLAQRDENGKLIPVKIDLRGEMAIKHELGKQAKPVIINEVIVRAFYLISRFCSEIKSKNIKSFDDLTRVDWREIAPAYNGTITRMITVASGTFMAIDLADAAIRGAIKSGGNWAAFGKEMLLRVNFVGIGRFVVAIGTDLHIKMKNDRKKEERAHIVSQMLLAQQIKLSYKQANMWQAAQEAEEAICALYDSVDKALSQIPQNLKAIKSDLKAISDLRNGIDKHNPGLANDLIKILE